MFAESKRIFTTNLLIFFKHMTHLFPQTFNLDSGDYISNSCCVFKFYKNIFVLIWLRFGFCVFGRAFMRSHHLTFNRVNVVFSVLNFFSIFGLKSHKFFKQFWSRRRLFSFLFKISKQNCQVFFIFISFNFLYTYF